MNDTWNAVGQILVRTPGVSFDGRARMLGLNAIRYRGEALMLLTRALPLSDSIKTLTTEVTVTTTSGTAMHSEGAAELLALLARELPAEVESVKARLAAEKNANEPASSRRRKSPRKYSARNAFPQSWRLRGQPRGWWPNRHAARVRLRTVSMTTRGTP